MNQSGSTAGEHHHHGLSRSAKSWAWYQGGRDTYIIVAGTYIFMPYFATQVVGDPVHGQSLIALYHLVSGLIVTFTAPFLGAAIDKMGARKPWMLLFNTLAVPLIAALWFAAPGGSVLPVSVVLAMLIGIGVLLSFGEVVYGSMLAEAATPPEQSGASGLALSHGNFVAIVVMAVLLVGFVLPGKSDWSFLPAEPLLGLGHVAAGPERFSIVLVALCVGLGLVPLLLHAKDAPRSEARFGAALRHGATQLVSLIRHAKLPGNALLYLVARMLYVDGKMALLIFGGVYAAGVMQWGPTELILLGMIVTVAGVAGGVFGGWLDSRFGPKRALEIEIFVTLVCAVAQLGITPTQTLYLWDSAPGARLFDWPVFATAPEIAYLVVAVILSVFGTASWASSRTLMARLAPPDQMGTFFGLYGLSGVATVWAAPLGIEFCTRFFQSQRAGLAPASAFMLAGLLLLFFVRGGGRVSGERN